ncbi:MAG: hypothetical protein ABW352_14540 [Polyangiales bacterium]
MTKLQRRRKRQQGAALVEGVMVGAMLVSLVACLFVIHRACFLHLKRLDDAREAAWQNAMNGCGSDNNTSTTSLAEQLKEGAMPFLDAIPTILIEDRSFEVTGGPFTPSGRREMKFICNPAPVQTKPLTNMVGWLGDMFT